MLRHVNESDIHFVLRSNGKSLPEFKCGLERSLPVS
jgi:hypothetical protein